MRRVLFKWRGLKVYSYPFMLYLGILSGLAAGILLASSLGLNPTRVYAAMLVLVLPAIAGSRLLFVAAHWRWYRDGRRHIWRSSEGGAALYGGLVASLLLSVPLMRVLTIPLGAFWDAATITILVGMIFAKVGCLLNGCCAGRPTASRVGLRLPDVYGVWRRRIPSQILEAFLAILILLLVLVLWRKGLFAGGIFLVCLTAYAAARWFLEAYREDVDRVAGLSLHRVISASLAALSVLGLIVLWPRGA
jgi:phosphatidylglycerol:prolipoprotein diacylglycerol transferase